jgi:uncharacterized protein (TIGR03067 family)
LLDRFGILVAMKQLFAILCLAFVGCSTVNRHTEKTTLLGQWRCISATIDGKPLNDKKRDELSLTITKDRYKTEDAKEALFDSVYSINSSTRPAQITLIGTEGDLTGKEAKGIFEVSGDLLLLCYTMPDKPAPVSFQSAPGSGAYFLVWKRNQP